MNTKNILAGVFGAAMCLAGVSCVNNGDSNDQRIYYPLSNCFAIVTDESDGTMKAVSPVNYILDLNVTKSSAELDITGLELPDGTKYPEIGLGGLGVGTDKNWTIVSAANPSVAVTGFGVQPLFTSFKLQLLDRMVGEAYVPSLAITYNVNNRYHVFSSRAGQIVTGTTVATAQDGSDFTNDEALVGLTFDVTTMKVAIELPASKFASGMPAQNIVLKDVPCSISRNGIATISAGAITPFIGDTPYPNFPITDLQGVYDFTGALSLRFTCTLGPAPYDVVINAKQS